MWKNADCRCNVCNPWVHFFYGYMRFILEPFWLFFLSFLKSLPIAIFKCKVVPPSFSHTHTWSLWVSLILSSWMLLVSRVTYIPLSPCQAGVWNRVTLPQCSPEWELGHWGTKAEKGAYGLETTPPPWSVKHSSPNMAQGSYPHWSAGNGLSPRQCASPPARSLLNWLSMQWVARV